MEHHHIEFVLHRWCMNYGPVIWLHVVANAILVLAFTLIPIITVIFVRRHATKIPKHYIFYFVAAFIFACGLTHAMEIWTMLYRPDYFAEGVIKMVSALVAIITAASISPALKYYAGFKDLAEYRLVNHELRNKLTSVQLENHEQTEQIERLHRIVEEGAKASQLERELLIKSAERTISHVQTLASQIEKLAGSRPTNSTIPEA